MAEIKNRVILLHGEGAFTQAPEGFTQGQLAVQHGDGAVNVKLHTLDKNGIIVSFPSEATVDAKVKTATDAASANAGKITSIEGKLEIIEGTGDGSIKKAQADAEATAAELVNTAKAELKGTENDGAGAETIRGAKKYTDEAIAAEVIRANDAYDAAGAAATAEGNAKTYADGLVKDAEGKSRFDAAGSAATAETNAKGYADGLNTAMDARVVALEAIDHDHTNKAVLDGITSDKVANWDAAEKNAKDYADGQIGTAKTELSGTITTLKTQLEGRLESAESDIDTLQSDVIKAKSVVSSESTSPIKVNPVTAEDGHVEYKLSLEGIATTEGLAALQGQVETLIGNDAETSVRTIVKQEIDAQLDPENLTEAFDTLTTVAEYIAEHKEEVEGTNGILSRISGVETDIADNIKPAITKNAGDITALTTTVADNLATAKKYTDDAITAEVTRSNKYTDDAITAEVNRANDAYDEKGAAAAAESAAKAKAQELNDALALRVTALETVIDCGTY